VTIEVGGAYSDHPHLPTDDILGDLRSNLRDFKLEDEVFIVEGSSHDARVQRFVKRIFERCKIGLFVVDSDGHIEAALSSFASSFRPNCLVVIDDYISQGALSKQQRIQPAVDRWVEKGLLHAFGVFGGTWVGHVNGQSALTALSQQRQIFLPDSGHCFKFVANSFDLSSPDSPQDFAASQILLLEDGRPLGPAHSLHNAIRLFGRGRYSHWRQGAGITLYFSSSDNTNPNDNGRNYSIEFADCSFDLTNNQWVMTHPIGVRCV
jgi:hypothetical protein